jgi:recombination protein RecR
MKNPLEALTSLFREFPGIGPRQAERFTYHLLSGTNASREQLAKEILNLGSKVSLCPSCFKFHTESSNLCSICKNPNRDKNILLVVAKDTDLSSVEKSHAYNGLYFVLGGTIPLLEKKPEDHVRMQELKSRLVGKDSPKEIIFAMNTTSEGEYTREVVELYIQAVLKEKNIKTSILGRGLSTGTEIEYSDSETLKSALIHRTQVGEQ